MIGNWLVREEKLKFLRHGSLSKVWSYISLLLVRCFGPEFAAWMTSLTFNRDANTGPLVLCFAREGFAKDIYELRRRSNFSFIMVMGGYTRFQTAWTPLKMQIQTFYQSYQGCGKEVANEKSYRYALRVIALAGMERGIDAVVSANFDYWQDDGFKRVCRDLNIPFVVLSREHPVIPHTCEEVTGWYVKSAYRFNGTVIAVAGQSTKRVLGRAGTVCNEEQLVVTGLPRFDAWIDLDTKKPLRLRPFVTLLTFTQGYLADNTFKEVLHSFCLASQRCHGNKVEFVIKTKDINDTILVKRLVSELGFSNVFIGHQLDLFALLPDSRLVINYNSLSLVEAAMARSEILIPAWGECKDRGTKVMYPIDNLKVSKVVRFAYNEKELLQIINASIEGLENPIAEEAYVEFVNEYIHRPDAKGASEEFASLLSKCLASGDSQKA